MDSKKLKTLFIGLAGVVLLVWAALFQLPDERIHLVFCDVGQGDATLIISGSNQVLVDGGPGPAAGGVLDCLSRHLPFWDRTIEAMVLTHPEADHFTGLIDVIERYNVSQFVVNSLAKDSQGFWEFRRAVLAEDTPVYSPQAGDKLKVGPMEFLVLWPEQKLGDNLVWNPKVTNQQSVLGAASYAGELNDTSITLKLLYGNFEALLPGDLSSVTESELAIDPMAVLKVAHHGSKYSTSSDFLEKLEPALAVISVGKNFYGHPTEEVLARLKAKNVQTLRTDEKGEIEVVTDGQTWAVKN